MVVLKHFFWPVKKPRFTCGFVQWLKEEQLCVVIFKRLLLPVNKPRFNCGFVEWFKRSSFVWLFLKDSFCQSINRGSLVVFCSG